MGRNPLGEIVAHTTPGCVRSAGRSTTRRLAPLLVCTSLLCCSPSSVIEIETPDLGAFLPDDFISVSGRLRSRVTPSTVVTVDGLEAPLGEDGAFSAVVATEPGRPFQSFEVVASESAEGGLLGRRRLTTVKGEAQGAGDRVPGGIAIRLSDLALDTIAGNFADVVADQVDIEALVRDSNPVATESVCITDTPFGCAGEIEVEANIERVRIGNLKVNADSRNEFLRLDVILKHLEIDYDTDGDVDCEGRIRVTKATIPGDYLVSPDELKPWRLDVNLVRDSLRVALDGFDHDFTGGVCDLPLVDDLVEEMLGNTKSLLREALKDVLDDPDGNGRKDSPVAEGVEDAIDYRTLWSPLGDALDVSVDTWLGAALADRQGLAIDFDPLLLEPAQDCDPGPELPASLRVAPDPVEWGELTPSGQPYDLAVALSASALNQMLRARVACGWLRTTVDSLDLGAGPLPLTAGLLSILIPDLAVLDPATPLVVELEPQLAPVVTGEAGPEGEPLDFWLAHWRTRLRDDQGTALAELTLELRAGLDLALSDDGASLAFELRSLPGEAVRVSLVRSLLELDEAQVEGAVAALVPTLAGSLGLGLDAIPLPPVAGLGLVGVEVASVGDRLVAFLALAPPATP